MDVDTRNKFLLAREKHIDSKKNLGRKDKTHTAIADVVPDVVQQQATAGLTLRGSDYDIIPETIFKSKTKKTFQEAGLNPVKFARVGFPPFEGILRYATHFNVPEGCFRVSYSEAMTAIRTTELASSESSIFDGELSSAFIGVATGLSDAATACTSQAFGAWQQAPAPRSRTPTHSATCRRL